MKRRKALQKMCNHLSSAIRRGYEAEVDVELMDELIELRAQIERRTDGKPK